jgi:hypothetical protein
MEGFSSEKPEIVERIQDEKKKERYLGGSSQQR